jgi:hypothetical protein
VAFAMLLNNWMFVSLLTSVCLALVNILNTGLDRLHPALGDALLSHGRTGLRSAGRWSALRGAVLHALLLLAGLRGALQPIGEERGMVGARREAVRTVRERGRGGCGAAHLRVSRRSVHGVCVHDRRAGESHLLIIW